MNERDQLIQRIEQHIAELKEIGTEEDLGMFLIIITPTMNAIRDGSAVWKKGGAKQ